MYIMYTHVLYVCMYVCMYVRMCMLCTYNPPSLSCHCAGLVEETIADAKAVNIAITLVGPVKIDIVAVLLSSHDQFSEGLVVINNVFQYL